MSTSNFDASASNFCQPPRQKKLWHPARIEPHPASTKFHVILAHERVTQDPKRFTNISECAQRSVDVQNVDRRHSEKNNFQPELEITRSFSVRS